MQWEDDKKTTSYQEELETDKNFDSEKEFKKMTSYESKYVKVGFKKWF